MNNKLIGALCVGALYLAAPHGVYAFDMSKCIRYHYQNDVNSKFSGCIGIILKDDPKHEFTETDKRSCTSVAHAATDGEQNDDQRNYDCRWVRDHGQEEWMVRGFTRDY
jgi:hypothetical protein